MANMPVYLRRALVRLLREAPDNAPASGAPHYGSVVERIARDIEDLTPERQSLASFVRRAGGVGDDRGDIAGMDLPGIGASAVVRPGGRTRDDLAVKAWEDGYFPDHSEPPPVNTFMNALDAEARAPIRRGLDDIEALGVDTKLRGKALREHLLALLREALGKRLPSDAPFGVALGLGAGFARDDA